MKFSIEKQIIGGFVFLLVILCGIGVFSWYSTAQLNVYAVSVKHAHEILTRLVSLLSIMTDAETSQRGYVITGDERFLEPYRGAVTKSDAEVRKLRELIIDPAQQRRLDALELLLAERLESVRQIIELRRTQDFEAARAQIATGAGKVIHDHIRHIVVEMDGVENEILSQREQQTRNIAQITLTVIVLGGVLAFFGIVIALVKIQNDIAALKRAEETMRIKNLELEVATEQAQAADRLKSAFLATMSHELRTPLNSIIGFTGIILQGLAGPLNSEQAKQLDMVQSSARHLLALINDLLDISKIEAGELKVSSEPFDLRVSIEKVAAIVKPLAEKKGLALRVELAPEIAGAVNDARRIEQILLNLLNNAIKFTERGEVALTADVATETVQMRIADTGMGIKPEDLATLFRPFQQIDTGLSRNHEGTGLGLAICRKLADLLGGDIQVESEWGKGSIFTFSLPLRGGTPS